MISNLGSLKGFFLIAQNEKLTRLEKRRALPGSVDLSLPIAAISWHTKGGEERPWTEIASPTKLNHGSGCRYGDS